MNKIIYSSLKDSVMKKDMPTKVYVVGGTGYANWLPNIELVDSEENADIIFFTGGSDVTPSLYGDKRHRTTQPNLPRDIREVDIAKRAIKAKKLILGVCRGAQFSCVMANGKLVQHQENLNYVHPIYTIEGNEILITSTHHQAMYPFNLPGKDYLVLAHAKDHSRYHYNGSNQEMSPKQEVEICYFPKIRALGIQGHPEMMWREKEYESTFNYLHKIFNLFVKGNLESSYR